MNEKSESGDFEGSAGEIEFENYFNMSNNN